VNIESKSFYSPQDYRQDQHTKLVELRRTVQYILIYIKEKRQLKSISVLHRSHLDSTEFSSISDSRNSDYISFTINPPI